MASTLWQVMAAILLEIPEDIAAALRFPPGRASEEVRREFAVFLVKEGLLPRKKARELAGMERVAFEDLLARRGVGWDAGVEEVFAEVEAAEQKLAG